MSRQHPTIATHAPVLHNLCHDRHMVHGQRLSCEQYERFIFWQRTFTLHHPVPKKRALDLDLYDRHARCRCRRFEQ